MNKFLAILGIVVLAGAGCASNVDTQTNIEANTETSDNVEVENRQAEEAMQPDTDTNAGSETATKTDVDGTTEVTIKTDDGAEFIVETESETDNNTDDENVIDVVLGADVGQTINMEIGNFFFKPNMINAKAGERIKLTFTKNTGFHTFVINDSRINLPINEGESAIFTAPTKPGTYEFYCDIGSHKSMGMVGSLIVK